MFVLNLANDDTQLNRYRLPVPGLAYVACSFRERSDIGYESGIRLAV